MKNKKRVFLIVIFCVLAIAWIIRYVSLNHYWRTVRPLEKRVIYQVGEEVPFGDNLMVSPHKYARGASITINRVQILDYQTFMEENQIEQRRSPNRKAKLVIVLDATFKNEGETVTIDLTDYYLHGIDQYYTTSFDIVESLNNGLLVELQAGEEFDAILAYPISEYSLSRGTWKNFDEYSLYLMATIRPELREIQIQ